MVQLCNKGNDKYEFGFNTQLKMNEVAGIGNWNTAEFWEYNTRTGVRANKDPVFVPWESSYSVNHSNPIAFSDPFGDFASRKEAREYKKEHGINGKINLNKNAGGANYYSIDEKSEGKNSGLSYYKDPLGRSNFTMADGVDKAPAVFGNGGGNSNSCAPQWLVWYRLSGLRAGVMYQSCWWLVLQV